MARVRMQHRFVSFVEIILEKGKLASAIVVHPVYVFFCPVEVFVHVVAEYSVNVNIVAQ